MAEADKAQQYAIDAVVSFYAETLGFMDLLFWLFAVGAAWQVAPRKLSDEEALAVYTWQQRSDQHGMISG